jgi:N-acetylneuraminate lyase
MRRFAICCEKTELKWMCSAENSGRKQTIMREGFNGIYVALITPYTKDGEVHYSEIKRLVRYLIEKGADGFYVGGSTGEAFLLNQEERRRILDAVLEANNGEKKVISHVGHISTGQACELARYAKSAGADAVSAISPFYYSFSAEEIITYYGEIMEAAGIPMFLYNYPKVSGFSLTPEILDRLCAMGDVAGVKFTSDNFFVLEQMRVRHPEITIWNGIDEMLSSGLIAGADGAIGSSYNILCPIAKRLYKGIQEANLDEVRALQSKINAAIALTVKNTRHTTAVKAVLELEGFSMGSSRSPFAPLPQSAGADVLEIYEKFVLPYA